jgi:hypothetical protein
METSMQQHGLLFVINETPSAMEEELNAWYDTEHIPERLSIDGFLSASRHVSTARARRYLALYDLTDIAVLKSDGYMAFVGDKFTPWTKRILSRTKVTRIEAVQTFPGDAVTLNAPRHLVVQWTGVSGGAVSQIEDAAKRCFQGKPGVTQLRIFAGSGAETGSMFVVVAGAGDVEALFDPGAFGSATKHLHLLESYLRY